MISQIKTIDDVKDFAIYLTKKEKLSFHPDDNFENYRYVEMGKVMPFYTKEEVDQRNNLMDECFKVCDRFKMDIYELMLPYTRSLFMNK